MGITNQLFPQERDETPGCLFNATSEDTINFTTTSTPTSNANTAVLSDIEAFADFMRMLAPAHSDAWQAVHREWTGPIRKDRLRPLSHAFVHHRQDDCQRLLEGPECRLSNQTVNLFSDLLVHHMGRGLADGITQGSAGPDEFRTAPLWGVGQRVFFLHDGRTSNLVEAIEAHKSKDSEANKVIDHFNRLKAQERQDVINFLRSL
jgi:hypothetical protein